MTKSRLRKYLLWIGVLFGSVVLLAARPIAHWMNHGDERRESWLQSLSTDALTSLADRSDADSLVRLVTVDRLAAAGDFPNAWKRADSAASALPAEDRSAVAMRIRAEAAQLDAEFGDPLHAADVLKRVAAARPTEPVVWVGQGALAARSKDYGEAIRCFKRAVELNSVRADSWRRLGAAYLAARMPADAVQPLQKAVQLAPADASGHASLGDALGQTTHFDEALAECREAARLKPEAYGFLPAISRASSARSDAEYAEGVAMLTQAIRDFPQMDHLVALLAGLHTRFGHYADARKLQQQYLTRKPHESTAWLAMVVICRRTGDTSGENAANAQFHRIIDREDNVYDLTRQIELHPQDANAHLRLSVALYQVGKTRQAYQALLQASKLDPQNPEITRMVGRVQELMQRMEQDGEPAAQGAPQQ